MPRQTIVQLLDDYDGKPLPEDTKPVSLKLGRTTYNLYLSDKNHGKLLEVLTPFIEGAETDTAQPVRPMVSNSDKERNKAVRAWAQSTGFKFKNAAGEEVSLGDRGRIPQEVYDAYDKAN